MRDPSSAGSPSRRIAPALLAAAALAAALGAAPAAASPREPERDLRAAIDAFGRAFVAADVATLRSLLAEGYLHVNGGSDRVIGREEWLAWMASRRSELERGELVVETYEVEDLQLRIHGAAAVVTGVVRSTGTRSGAPFATRVRFTNLWVEQKGAWRRAAFHDSPLPEPGG